MRSGEGYGKFVMTVHAFDFVSLLFNFVFLFAYCKKTDTSSLFTVGIL